MARPAAVVAGAASPSLRPHARHPSSAGTGAGASAGAAIQRGTDDSCGVDASRSDEPQPLGGAADADLNSRAAAACSARSYWRALSGAAEPQSGGAASATEPSMGGAAQPSEPTMSQPNEREQRVPSPSAEAEGDPILSFTDAAPPSVPPAPVLPASRLRMAKPNRRASPPTSGSAKQRSIESVRMLSHSDDGTRAVPLPAAS